MEKTSKEYAEKLANDLIPYDKSNSHAPIQWEKHKGKIDKYRKTFIEGYLKAVEETNVKELRDAVEEMINCCLLPYPSILRLHPNRRSRSLHTKGRGLHA